MILEHDHDVFSFIFWVMIRLGFLIDFLSHAAIVGFMGGAAITIALQQLKGFLGIKNFTKNTDIISVMHSVFASAHHGVSHDNLFLISNTIDPQKKKKKKKRRIEL